MTPIYWVGEIAHAKTIGAKVIFRRRSQWNAVIALQKPQRRSVHQGPLFASFHHSFSQTFTRLQLWPLDIILPDLLAGVH